MKRTIYTIHLERLIFSMFAIVIFIIIASILIVGLGKGGKFNTPDFSLNPDNLIFKNSSSEEPKIKVLFTKENKVKEIYLEEYVRGVVAAEMPAEFQIEALKAQAVAARTYALAHMEQFGGKRYSDKIDADVTDSIQCQVYMDKVTRLNSWPANERNDYWNKITQAVKSTAGEVLTYNGELVMEPYYFSISSGMTENAEDVFSSSEPYLKNVSSTGDNSYRKYRTSNKFNYSELANKLNTQYPQAELSSRKLENEIFVIKRTNAGGVKTIKVGNVTISGPQFRKALGINSANFTITFGSKYITISCLGYGHDVGMSQSGANEMAKKNNNYKDILKHYYQGIEIKKMSYANSK